MNTTIQATDRISSVLKRDEKLIDVLVQASSTFSKLKNPLMRRTMASLVTVEQAAQIAGIDAADLVTRLNHALSHGGPSAEAPKRSVGPKPKPAPVPAELAAVPAEQLVDCDVREDLRAGKEPFGRIMSAVTALQPGQVLRVRAIFDPVPLYAVLAKRGLAHFTEQLDDEDFRVWFFADDGAKSSVASPSDASAPADGDVIILDVRGLEPPEPMVQTLEALEAMPRGKTLIQLNVRVPQFLLPKLDERGFTYEVREQSAELVRLFIRHKPT